jgi:hypothetical protein
MKKLIVALSLSIAFTPPHFEAKAQEPPPDFYNDYTRAGFGFWRNPSPGWVVGTDGDPVMDVQFVGDGAFPRAFIRRDTRISFVMASVDTSTNTPDTLRRLDMSFSGEQFLHPDADAIDIQPGHRNFYFPHCADGITNVKAYNRILYADIYAGIDLWLYCGQRGQKMALVIHPGANPDDIRLTFDGQNQMDLDILGNLRLLLQDKWIVLPEAVAYQYQPDNTILPLNWTADYVPNNNTGQVGFTFDVYDNSKPLVLLIGPPPGDEGNHEEVGLCWSTYLGGTSVTTIHESAVDVNDNYYVAGNTSSDWTVFPGQAGSSYLALGTVAFTTQFDQQDQIQWRTYQGGLSSALCESHGLVTDYTGEKVYMGGWTNSSAFTVWADGNAYYQPVNTIGTQKAFVARLDAEDGTREWSTYLSDGWDRILGMAYMHNSIGDRLVITGQTDESLPTAQDPLPTVTYPYSGGRDAFLVMFNEFDRIVYATYLGGSGNDEGHELRSVSSGAYASTALAGLTWSQTLQSAPCNGDTYCYGPTGTSNTFLMEFNFNGLLTWSTFLYTPECTGVFWDNSLAFDPVTHDVAIGTYGHLCEIEIVGQGYHGTDYSGALIGGMIHRFSGIDRSLVWSSYLGGEVNSEAHIRAMAFDANGALYVGGQFGREDELFVPIGGMYEQLEPYPNYDGGTSPTLEYDPFVMRFQPGNIYDWGTYIGGYGAGSWWMYESIYTMVWRNGALYVAGVHAKFPDVDETYFASDEGNGIPYFSSDHPGGEQGFIASMCLELSIGASELWQESQEMKAWFDKPNALVIDGLPPGRPIVEVLNSIGQVIVRMAVAPVDGRGSITLPVDPPAGAYMVHVEDGSVVMAVRH